MIVTKQKNNNEENDMTIIILAQAMLFPFSFYHFIII